MPEESSPPPPLRSPHFLKLAIEATEELLETLRNAEDTPQVLANRQFYTERLALLKSWEARLIDADPDAPEQ